MTDDDKDYMLNRGNLTQPIQRQLSQKQKHFFPFFFFVFLKSLLNFTHLLKKMMIIADVFPKLRAWKHMVRQMSKKSCFIGPFDIQHRKWIETLLQSERQHLHHI